ncbi:phosphoenolpyruvate carboxykinase (ATP) [Novispirillum itersonii]|uniref:hypothetical protein n=1 Tax=Novispirillum itersonii TaxID=189 RepID=UPI0003777F03|nr:hypothetical protein [Novispirillum itersonii]
MHHYRISGWTLSADRPLPYLHPCPAPTTATETDLSLRSGPVAPPLLPVRLDRDGISIGADGAAVIDVPGCVRIGVTGGRHVTVDPAPGVPWAEVQTWLLGPCLGLICHQRGVLPLHACAIGSGEKALAIVGNSRAGKSTTATALVQRGHRLLGDDVLVTDPDSGLAYPCFPAVKLWDSSRAALSVSGEDLQPVFRKAGKWHVPMRHAFDPTPRPLTAIVHLRPDAKARRPALTRCAPAHAAAILTAMTYRSYLADALHGRQHVLSTATRLAGRIPVWQLTRTTEYTDLPEMLALLEALISG